MWSLPPLLTGHQALFIVFTILLNFSTLSNTLTGSRINY